LLGSSSLLTAVLSVNALKDNAALSDEEKPRSNEQLQ